MRAKKQTCGTRRGSGIPAGGAGRWGPAKGTRPAITADTQPTGEAKSQGKAEAKAFKAMLSPFKQEVADTWLAVMRDANAPAASRIAAGEKIALFSGEVLATKQIVESENVHRIISEKPLTEEEWQAQYGSKTEAEDAS